MKKILIIEDDKHILEALKVNLELQNYKVKTSESGLKGFLEWQNWHPDLIVLDIMLPELDGISVLKKIREKDIKIPILILSAKSSSKDIITGLTYGVDDYLAKPFDLDEFFLRVKRLILKSSWYKEEEKEVFSFGKNQINFRDLKAFVGSKQEINLTKQEVKLLKFFIKNKKKILSREEILKSAFGYEKKITTRTIDNFIVRFRKYFEKNPKKPIHFCSLRSIGYLFNQDTKEDKV